MAQFAVKDDFFDAQTMRAAAAADFGGANVGEVMAIARRVKSGDLVGWHDEWLAAADRAMSLGEAAEAGNHHETARLAYLRACTYYRSAGSVFLSRPVDPRLSASIAKQTEAFRRAIPFLDASVEPVTIPFGAASLPGYHFRVLDDGDRRPTVILLDGYDGTVEETYFGNAQAALDRGYDVLAFDGPGQGSVLVDQGIPLRPDWENVLTPVLDWLLQRPGVDPDRVALIGWSLGGYLAPRAASGEHRLAACISDSGFYDLFDTIASRLPPGLRQQIPDGNRAAVATVTALMNAIMRRPTGGWYLRRGLYVNDVPDMMAYIRQARDYTLKGYAEQITCPTLICHGESDPVSASAPQIHADIEAAKKLVTFLERDGAGDHCELGARQLYLAASFDWLDEILTPQRPGS